MKKYLFLFFACLLSLPIMARPLRVVVCYPYIGDLVDKLRGPHTQVFVLARGDYNPHVIIPRPSYIARVRHADLVIINGGQLEIGWIPQILRQANNPTVQPGERGFLDLSQYVKMIDVPTSVSREQGDIHPEGNPHYYLDPYNIPPLAKAIVAKLCEIDPENASICQANLQRFLSQWEKKLAEWSGTMKPYAGAKVLEYHKNYDYFLKRFDLKLAGTVEPLPGIPPTSKHIEQLEVTIRANPIRCLFQDVYNPDDASRHLCTKFQIKLVVLPHDIGATPEAKDIFSLYDDMVRRITQ